MDKSDHSLESVLNSAKRLEEGALETLTKEYYTRIYKFYYYRTKTNEDAEDLTNEVFIRMVRMIQSQKGDFQAWLFKIARNLLIDYYRKRDKMKTISIEENIVELESRSSKDEENSLQTDEIRKLVTYLTDEQKEVILLKFMEGYTNEEAAQKLKKTVGSIKLLQFRAIATLRDVFKKLK